MRITDFCYARIERMEIGGAIFVKPRKWRGISSNAVLYHFAGAGKMADVKSKRAVSGFIPLF